MGAERLGIDLSSLRTAEDCRRLLAAVLAAVARGEIAPAEGSRIARRVDPWLRAVRRRAGFDRWSAYETGPARTPLG